MSVPFRGKRKLPTKEREAKRPKHVVKFPPVHTFDTETRCPYSTKDICQDCLIGMVNEVQLIARNGHFLCPVCGWKCPCLR